MLFDPTKVSDDARHNFFCHPDIEDDYRTWEPLFTRLNCEVVVVHLEKENPELRREHAKRSYQGDFSIGAKWMPKPPAGDGWLWVLKGDSESGPFATFVRRPPDTLQNISAVI